MIPVTKSYLPDIAVYNKFVERIWKNQWLTNRGELVLELEEKLKKHLECKKLIVTTNGTLPIQIALKVLGKGGEIITTPFSYIATSSSIVWEGCKPVFADIHPDYLTVDETQIESLINKNTTAILFTHVFGNPCNVSAIGEIADKYKLKVIYDAAHCFGVEYDGQSIFNYGDVSTCSFHATKIFHTAEGGAIFCKDDDLYHQLYYSHNFGHNGPLEFHGLGINAKISELQAAMGLSLLPEMSKILADRQQVVEYYLKHLNYSVLRTIRIRENTKWNYSYFPIIFPSEKKLIAVLEALNQQDIFPRRYFYPSLNTVGYLKGQHMPVSESIAKCIACLPLYTGLQENELKLICDLINKIIANQ